MIPPPSSSITIFIQATQSQYQYPPSAGINDLTPGGTATTRKNELLLSLFSEMKYNGIWGVASSQWCGDVGIKRYRRLALAGEGWVRGDMTPAGHPVVILISRARILLPLRSMHCLRSANRFYSFKFDLISG